MDRSVGYLSIVSSTVRVLTYLQNGPFIVYVLDQGRSRSDGNKAK